MSRSLNYLVHSDQSLTSIKIYFALSHTYMSGQNCGLYGHISMYISSILIADLNCFSLIFLKL